MFVVRAIGARASGRPGSDAVPRHHGRDSRPLLVPGRGCHGRQWAATACPSEKRMSGSTCSTAIPFSTSMTARSRSPDTVQQGRARLLVGPGGCRTHKTNAGNGPLRQTLTHPSVSCCPAQRPDDADPRFAGVTVRYLLLVLMEALAEHHMISGGLRSRHAYPPDQMAGGWPRRRVSRYWISRSGLRLFHRRVRPAGEPRRGADAVQQAVERACLLAEVSKGTR